jgi:predicted acyltransferase
MMTFVKDRYYSLDVFRGFTVALMILVNYSVDFPFAFSLLKHSDWNGCTVADLVFPFFLFAVGSALVFSKAKVEDSTTQFYIGKVVRRAAILFFFGLIISWAPFIKITQDNTIALRSSIRIMGILQRIALCYFIAAIFTKLFREKSLYIISVLILLFYWFIVYYFGDNQDPYGITGFAGIKFDLAILGNNHVHLDKGIMLDSEGLLSTTTAIVVVIAGYLFSNYVVTHKKMFD